MSLFGEIISVLETSSPLPRLSDNQMREGCNGNNDNNCGDNVSHPIPIATLGRSLATIRDLSGCGGKEK